MAVGSGVSVALGVGSESVGREVAVAVGERGDSETHPANTSKAHKHREETFSRLMSFGLNKSRVFISGG